MNEEPEDLHALAAMASLFGAEMKNIDSKFIEKPHHGGLEFDPRELVNSARLKNISTDPSKELRQTSFSNTKQLKTNSSVMPVITDEKLFSNTSDSKLLLEEVQKVKEILYKIDNNLSKISGMAGKIFSNLNTR